MHREIPKLENFRVSTNCWGSKIHEYSIMSDFAESVKDEGKQNKLFFALDDKGAFRYFKDVLFQNGLEADYYEFRHRAYVDIAQSWCEENDIPYATGS